MTQRPRTTPSRTTPSRPRGGRTSAHHGQSAWRVVALVLGLVALVAVRSLVRGWPWWTAGLACLLAFALVTRAVNAMRPALVRRRRPPH